MNPKKYAEAVRDAVNQATRIQPVCVGARIEEILGMPLANYPDEVMPLDLLPSIDGFKFIAWTPEFIAVEMELMAFGNAFLMSETGGGATCRFVVGWKPIRREALATQIVAEQPATGPGNPAWEAERKRCMEQGPFFW